MNYDHLFKHSAKGQYYVYVYTNPTEPGRYESITSTLLHLPFYVGKGRGNRYRIHLSIKNNHHPFYNKLNKMKVLGIVPNTTIIATFNDEMDAYEFEVKLIAHYTQLNIQLTNLEPGGQIHGPGRAPNASRTNRSSPLKGTKRSDVVKRKISAAKLLHHPTAKHWLVIAPTGEEYRTKTLRQLIEHQLGFAYNNYKTLINVHLAGRSMVSSGTMKGWQVFELS